MHCVNILLLIIQKEVVLQDSTGKDVKGKYLMLLEQSDKPPVKDNVSMGHIYQHRFECLSLGCKFTV